MSKHNGVAKTAFSTRLPALGAPWFLLVAFQLARSTCEANKAVTGQI